MFDRTLVMIATSTLAGAQLLAAAGEPKLQWSPLAPLPDTNGVAGAFAGITKGTLLVAGGANFPEKMPWDSGQKVWHDTVYALDKPNQPWRIVGKLPRALAYGLSLTTPRGVLCAGGSDAAQHFAESFLMTLSNEGLRIQSLKPLPVPVANGAGAMLGSKALLCGGSDRPGEQTALNRFFALNLAQIEPKWEELPPCPGEPRILAVAGATSDAFYLFGGAALRREGTKVKRVLLRDAWRYIPGKNWQRLNDLPRPCVAAPSPAPTAGGMLLLVGGDDGSLAGFSPAEKHPGFPRGILAFHLETEKWLILGQVPASRATLPTVAWNGAYVFPSGELRPGVRSPEVWMMRMEGPTSP